MLIRPGLEAADKAGAQTCVEASQTGLPLCMRYQWGPVDEMVIDMILYGEQQETGMALGIVKTMVRGHAA